MKTLLLTGKWLTDILPYSLLGWLVLVIGAMPLDAYQFIQDSEPYRDVHQPDGGANWQVRYLMELLLTGLAALAALLLFVLSFRRNAPRWQVNVRRIFTPLLLSQMAFAYWQWAPRGFDH